MAMTDGKCPDCGGECVIAPGSGEVCEQTGYSENEDYFTCRDCGAVGDPEELECSELDAVLQKRVLDKQAEMEFAQHRWDAVVARLRAIISELKDVSAEDWKEVGN